MRKMSPTWPQDPPKRSRIIFSGGLRVPLPADHLSWENASKSILVHDLSRWGVDPRALWRFADQRGGPTLEKPQQGPLEVTWVKLPPPKKPSKTLPKPFKNRPKIDARGFWELPKSSQNRCWSHLGAHFGTMLSPDWKKMILEHQKNNQKVPKSAQKTPQTVSNPSQMEPKTLPNPIFKAFFGVFFAVPILHWFFVDFLLIFC